MTWKNSEPSRVSLASGQTLFVRLVVFLVLVSIGAMPGKGSETLGERSGAEEDRGHRDSAGLAICDTWTVKSVTQTSELRVFQFVPFEMGDTGLALRIANEAQQGLREKEIDLNDQYCLALVTSGPAALTEEGAWLEVAALVVDPAGLRSAVRERSTGVSDKMTWVRGQVNFRLTIKLELLGVVPESSDQSK